MSAAKCFLWSMIKETSPCCYCGYWARRHCLNSILRFFAHSVVWAPYFECRKTKVARRCRFSCVRHEFMPHFLLFVNYCSIATLCTSTEWANLEYCHSLRRKLSQEQKTINCASHNAKLQSSVLAQVSVRYFCFVFFRPPE